MSDNEREPRGDLVADQSDPARDAASNAAAREANNTAASDGTPAAPARRRNRAQSTARRVVRLTTFLSQGSFLPMAVDKVRNNVRSAPLLVAVYVMAVLLVSAIIVLGLRDGDVSNGSFKMLLPPPATVKLGEPWPTISVQLLDGKGHGVHGEPVDISVSPLERIPLQADVGTTGHPTLGYIKCLEQVLLPAGRDAMSYIPQCIPNSGPVNALAPNRVLTDEFGIATFRNVTLRGGFPGSYFFVVTYSSEKFLTSFFTASTSNVSLELDTSWGVFPDLVEFGERLSFAVTGEWYATKAPVPRSAIASIRQPPSVVASLVPVHLTSDGSKLPLTTSPFGPDGTADTAFIATNSSVNSSSVVRIVEAVGMPAAASSRNASTPTASEGTAAGELVTVRYRAQFVFTNVSVIAFNSRTIHFGVLFFGQTIPLRRNAYLSATMDPYNIITPTMLNSTVTYAFAAIVPHNERVTVTGPMRARMMEGESFDVVARILDGDGRPVSGKVVYVHSHVANTTASRVLSEAFTAPINNMNAKVLLGQHSSVDSDSAGRVYLQTRFSVFGAVSDYILTATIDGIPAKFVSFESLDTMTASDYPTRRPYPAYTAALCDVVSRVKSVSVVMPDDDPSKPEVVATPWSVTPQVHVMDVDGRPMPGKQATIAADSTSAATRAAQPVVFGQARPSDDYGLSAFLFVTVTSAKAEGPIDFVIRADNVNATFTRSLIWPTNIDAKTAGFMAPGACSSLVPSRFPRRVFGSRPFTLVFDALDVYGNTATLPNQTAFLVVATQSLATTAPRIALPIVNGTVTVPGNTPPVTKALVFFATISPLAMIEYRPMALVSSYMALAALPRYHGAQLSIEDDGREMRVDVDGIWEHISPDAPLTVTTRNVWSPGFVKTYYPPDAQVLSTSLTISRANESVATLYGSSNRVPGLFYFAIEIDNGVTSMRFPSMFPLEVTAISIVSSALRNTTIATDSSTGYPIATVRAQQRLPPPTVTLRNKTSGAPVENVFAIAVLGYSDKLLNASSADLEEAVTWVRYTSAAFEFAYGTLVGGMSSARNATLKAVTGRSRSDGTAYFPPLFVPGANTSKYFYLKYCYVDDLLMLKRAEVVSNFSSSSTNHTSVCAYEPAAIVIPRQDQLLAQPVTSVFAAAPGTDVPPVEVKLAWSHRLTPYSDLPQVQMLIVAPEDRYVLSRESEYLFDPSTRSFSVDGLLVDNSAPEGTHLVKLIGPGFVTEIVVQVSTEVTGVLPIVQPPPVLSVGAFASVVVVVRGLNSVELPNQRVQMSLRRVSANCSGEQCGVLSPQSRTSGTSDPQFGTFYSDFSMDTAATGKYVLDFQVVSRPSQDGVVQRVAEQMLDVSYRFGLPLRLMLKEVAVLNPELTYTGNIIAYMLDPSRRVKLRAEEAGTGDGNSPLKAAATDVDVSVALISFIASSQESAGASSEVGQYGAELIQALESPQTIAQLTSSEFEVVNPVDAIVVTRQPSVDIRYTVSNSAVNRLLNVNRVVVLDSSTCPIVRVLDVYGQPVPRVKVTAFSPDSRLGVTMPPSEVFTDDDGVASFEGMTVAASTSGDFFLNFSSRGSMGNRTAVPIVVRITEQSSQETMKVFAFILSACFSPMFLATVPHTWWVYQVVASLAALAFALAASVLVPSHWDTYVTSQFIWAYAVIALVLVWVLAIGFGVMAVSELLVTVQRRRGAAVPGWLAKLDVNCEREGTNVLAYSRWLTNTCVEKQVEDEPTRVQLRLKPIKERLSGTVTSVTSRVDRTREGLEMTLLGEDKEGDANPNARTKAELNRAKPRPPLQRPRSVPDMARFPPNLMVVLALSFTLMLLLNMFAVHLLDLMHAFTASVLSYLPKPEDDESVREANRVVVKSLAFSIAAVAAAYPNLAFMQSVIEPLESIDIVSIIVQIRTLLAALKESLDVSVTVALVCANLTLLVTAAFTIYQVKDLIRRMRRRGGGPEGDAYASPAVGRVELYIGLHCMHYVLVFIIVAFVMFAIMMLLITDRVRVFIWDETKLLLLASITSVLISLVTRVIFVKMFLLDAWLVVRPEAHAIWTFVALVLGVFTGIVGTIVRWVQTVVFFTICFAKLDKPMFPFMFARFDKAHAGFAAMVVQEANNSNPIYITFAAALLLDRMVKQALAAEYRSRANADDIDGQSALAGGDFSCAAGDDCGGDELRQQKTQLMSGSSLTARTQMLHAGLSTAMQGNVWERLRDEQADYDALLDDRRAVVETPVYEFARFSGVSAKVVNVMRSMLSADHGATVDIAAWARERRRTRIASRWWLLWVLHRNPSIRELRKVRRVPVGEGEPALAVVVGDGKVTPEEPV